MPLFLEISLELSRIDSRLFSDSCISDTWDEPEGGLEGGKSGDSGRSLATVPLVTIGERARRMVHSQFVQNFSQDHSLRWMVPTYLVSRRHFRRPYWQIEVLTISLL